VCVTTNKGEVAMSNNRDNYWDDEDEDIDTVELSDTDLVKKLRRDLKVALRENKEFKTQVSELTKAQKERILTDVLTSRGVNPKIASFIPDSVELNADAINAFIDANADIFHVEASSKASNVNQADIDNIKKINEVTTGAESSESSDSLEALIKGATTEDELLSILSGL
jgi:hypothetical protein